MTGPTVGTSDSSDKQPWTPPTLAVLGDAALLTQAQALAVNDGGGGSS